MAREYHWSDDILAHMESGIDVSQIDERLRLTPTQRLERLQEFVDFLEELRNGHAVPRSD